MRILRLKKGITLLAILVGITSVVLSTPTNSWAIERSNLQNNDSENQFRSETNVNKNKFRIGTFVITVALLIIVLGILSQDIQRVQALMNTVEDCQVITKVKKSGHYTMQCCDVPDLNGNGRIEPDDEIAGIHMPDCSRYDCTVGIQGECKPIESEAAPITPVPGTVMPSRNNSAGTQVGNGTSLIK